MNRLFLIFFVFCFSSTTALADQRLEQIKQAVLEDLKADFNQNTIPGLGVEITLGDENLMSLFFGSADSYGGKPVGPDSSIPIASISKAFTALAVHKLFERGHFHLDDPIKDHLEWFSMAGPYSDLITIRQLLNHTSGMQMDAGIHSWGVDYEFLAREQLLMPKDLNIKDAIQSQEVVFKPGTAYKYSTLGPVILGQLVGEVAQNQLNYECSRLSDCFKDYIRKEILSYFSTPKTFGFLSDFSMDPNRMDLHGMRVGNHRLILPQVNESYDYAAGGGMQMTFEGGAEFVKYLHRIGQDENAAHNIMSRDTLFNDLMRAPSVNPLSGQGFAYSMLMDNNEEPYLVFGHTGGFVGAITALMYDPETTLGIAIGFNAEELFVLQKHMQTVFNHLRPYILEKVRNGELQLNNEGWKQRVAQIRAKAIAGYSHVSETFEDPFAGARRAKVSDVGEEALGAYESKVYRFVGERHLLADENGELYLKDTLFQTEIPLFLTEHLSSGEPVLRFPTSGGERMHPHAGETFRILAEEDSILMSDTYFFRRVTPDFGLPMITYPTTEPDTLQ